MVTALKTKPGINGANVLSIPTEWDATWFRHFINNSLKGADVRNAVGTGGIVVSGNISSPYATIDGSGISSGVTQIIAGTNVTVSPAGGTGVVTVNATGAVTSIVAGTGISVSPAGGTGAVTVTNAATTTSVVGTANEIAVSTASGVSTLSFSPNIVIPAQSSGIAIDAVGLAGAVTYQSEHGTAFSNNGSLGITVLMNSSGADFGQIANSQTQVWGLGYGTSATSYGSNALQWNTDSTVMVGNGTGTGSAFQSVTNRAVLQINSPGTSGSMIDFSVNGTSNGYIYCDTTEMYFLNDSSSLAFYPGAALAGYVTNPGGIVTASHAGFMTHGNASYQRDATNGGYLDGNYGNIETGATPGCIYTIGGANYIPSATSLNTMYGIGYTVGSQTTGVSGVSGMLANSWGMYVANAGTATIFLDATNGVILANVAVESAGMNCLHTNVATAGGAGGKVTAQSGGTASGGNAGDIILIY